MGSVLLIFFIFLCCPIMCLYVLNSVLWCTLRFSVRLYLQLFVGGLMSYLCYLCLVAHSGVQPILCCVFLCSSSSCVTCFPLFFVVLCDLFCQFLWIVPSVFSNVYNDYLIKPLFYFSLEEIALIWIAFLLTIVHFKNEKKIKFH